MERRASRPRISERCNWYVSRDAAMSREINQSNVPLCFPGRVQQVPGLKHEEWWHFVALGWLMVGGLPTEYFMIDGLGDHNTAY